MREFNKQEDEEKFVIDFLQSDYWEYMKNMIEGRRLEVLRFMGDVRTSDNGRAMLNGRLLELEHLLHTPTNMVQFAKAQKAIADQGDETGMNEYIRDTIFQPEIVT